MQERWCGCGIYFGKHHTNPWNFSHSSGETVHTAAALLLPQIFTNTNRQHRGWHLSFFCPRLWPPLQLHTARYVVLLRLTTHILPRRQLKVRRPKGGGRGRGRGSGEDWGRCAVFRDNGGRFKLVTGVHGCNEEGGGVVTE